MCGKSDTVGNGGGGPILKGSSGGTRGAGGQNNGVVERGQSVDTVDGKAENEDFVPITQHDLFFRAINIPKGSGWWDAGIAK